MGERTGPGGAAAAGVREAAAAAAASPAFRRSVGRSAAAASCRAAAVRPACLPRLARMGTARVRVTTQELGSLASGRLVWMEGGGAEGGEGDGLWRSFLPSLSLSRLVSEEEGGNDAARFCLEQCGQGGREEAGKNTERERERGGRRQANSAAEDGGLARSVARSLAWPNDRAKQAANRTAAPVAFRIPATACRRRRLREACSSLNCTIIPV